MGKLIIGDENTWSALSLMMVIDLIRRKVKVGAGGGGLGKILWLEKMG